MLAKNYDKEGTKISFTGGETVMISPKLDGIRCIVTFDKQNQQILFFSRAGTLFDCCDALIEPHLRHLFEMDESLVLDGELYNDFANQKRIRHYLQHRPKNSANDSPFDRVFPKLCRKPTTGKNGREKLYQDISFEQLVSAIRTTRGKRTEEVAAKQRLLQYHIFDVMYSSQFVESPTLDGSHYPFSHRYNLLLSMLSDLAKYNKKHLGKSVYDATVIQPVPALVAENEEQVEAALGTAMQVGFEGIMVRREGSATDSPKRSVKRSRRSSSAGVFGGYECGKRSSSLLKYKKMQDDEFIIVGAVEGKGKLKGRLGAFVCQAKKNKGLTFTVTPATTEQKKKEMWSVWSKSYKGKALTVQYQDLTPDGIPRFPVGKCIRGAASGEDWI
ncbi:DNA ligase (ATP) [Angomonas deanei]|uniref:ATP dependent DNA ligase domain/DNA ligase OB-like domain containing protein, putative n=1 Tax=Angomonas deanei TaxID=59799 RepID=A0A7G2C5P8_9TRYP|nr:DNA ligase (ATP) [Angomonas deanei]CAD2215060.1 ATP dependent DNA ligase domain/DNA ligase OB-like domain containing protein, putative [Angomonas deanei]|eukprot:EPY40805.1 DNA ligase (ATP) [Angomonas deanei]